MEKGPSDPNSAEGSSTSRTQSEAESGPSTTGVVPRTCAQCHKQEANPEAKPLKPCAKCQTALYCDRECQKADFKVHKKVCAALAQVYSQGANYKPAGPRRPPREGHRDGLRKWQFDT